jgi:hypothetical protein
MRMAIWHAGNTIRYVSRSFRSDCNVVLTCNSNIISGFLAAGILHHMGGMAGLYR